MKALRSFFILFLALIIVFSGQAQALNETSNVSYLKSILFKSKDEKHQFPIVEKGVPFTLEFDDLLASENDYYYRISYFNHDWTPSNLFKNEFLT